MIKGRVSIITPSRNEQFLPQTVRDLLAKSVGDIEVIAILEGYWPPETAEMTQDKRVRLLHRGTPMGMRPGINAAVQMSTGEYLLKIDAHCMVEHGYDAVLKADCDGDWVAVPRRYSLNPEEWKIENTGKKPVDVHYLSYPFETLPDGSPKPGAGLHGTIWRERAKERIDVLIDDEMSSQGSCWFMTRGHWDRTVGPMDYENYGSFIQEMQEVGLKTWLSGGRLVCNKKTWYAHLHKGKRGRGYFIDKREWDRGSQFALEYWMQDRWPERKRNLRWLIEKFAPVPGWPADLDEAFVNIPKKIAALAWTKAA